MIPTVQAAPACSDGDSDPAVCRAERPSTGFRRSRVWSPKPPPAACAPPMWHATPSREWALSGSKTRRVVCRRVTNSGLPGPRNRPASPVRSPRSSDGGVAGVGAMRRPGPCVRSGPSLKSKPATLFPGAKSRPSSASRIHPATSGAAFRHGAMTFLCPALDRALRSRAGFVVFTFVLRPVERRVACGHRHGAGVGGPT